MRRNRRRMYMRPSKGTSAMSFAMGIVFTIIGVTFVIPTTLRAGPAVLFGLVWTGFAVYITVSHGMYLFGKKKSPGPMGVEIYAEDEPEEDAQENPGSVEERMRQLRELYDQRLITQEEYEEKRKELLKEL